MSVIPIDVWLQIAEFVSTFETIWMVCTLSATIREHMHRYFMRGAVCRMLMPYYWYCLSAPRHKRNRGEWRPPFNFNFFGGNRNIKFSGLGPRGFVMTIIPTRFVRSNRTILDQDVNGIRVKALPMSWIELHVSGFGGERCPDDWESCGPNLGENGWPLPFYELQTDGEFAEMIRRSNRSGPNRHLVWKDERERYRDLQINGCCGLRIELIVASENYRKRHYSRRRTSKSVIRFIVPLPCVHQRNMDDSSDCSYDTDDTDDKCSCSDSDCLGSHVLRCDVASTVTHSTCNGLHVDCDPSQGCI